MMVLCKKYMSIIKNVDDHGLVVQATKKYDIRL